MNQVLAVLFAVGAACLLMSVSGAPSNFDYGDDLYAFADNATTPISNSSASTPSANTSSSTPAVTSANITGSTPTSNVTTPATGNGTTPATGNMTTPASGNMTTPTGKTTPAKSTIVTTAVVTTPTKSNVTASPDTDDNFSTGSFFGGAGAMVGLIAVVALVCMFMKRGKSKGYNAM